MGNIDPTLYGRIMLERKQAEQLYNLKRLEIAFERYKKRIKTIEEQEHTDKKGELKDGNFGKDHKHYQIL
jgi:hypothetical protein